MIGFRINQKFLDTPPGTRVTMIYNSPIFFGDRNPDIIPGSYSLPITFPLTARNKDIFQHSNRVDVYSMPRSISNVDFYAGGVHQSSGTLYLLKSGTSGFKCSFMMNHLDGSADALLRESELGGHQEASPNAMSEKAIEICNSPKDFDFAFFPIYNPVFIDESEKEKVNEFPECTSWHNYYTAEYGFNYTVNSYTGVTPFLSLRVLLEKSAEILGLVLINNFQTDDELNTLFCYNNQSIHNITSWYQKIEFANHAPYLKASEFIKAIATMFFLGVEINVKNKTLEIFKLKDIIKAPTELDWSHLAQAAQNANPIDLAEAIQYPHSDIFPTSPVGQYTEVDTVQEVLDGPDGTFYIRESDAYYSKDSSTPLSYTFLKRKFKELSLEGIKDKITLLAAPVEMYFSSLIFNSGTTYAFAGPFPYIKNPGTIRYIDENDANNNIDQRNEFPLRLLFFRGWQPDARHPPGSNINIPYSNNNYFSPHGVPQFNYSLLMNGERGIQANFAQEWIYAMRKGKLSMRKMNLTLAEVSRFSFKRKVRIENMHYLVKRLKVTYTEDGVLPAEAELITVT